MTPGVTLASRLMPICLLASACAGAVSSINREAALLSLAPPPEGRTCGVATAPSVLPSAAALVDSVRLISGARTPPGDPPAYALLSLRFDDHGRPTWTRVIETRLLEGSTDSDVDRAFEQSLRGRRFRPALIDGQGVTAWTEWPLRASSAH